MKFYLISDNVDTMIGMRLAGIEGIIITKLDGTAKGGALISITQKYNMPIFALGVGENIDDLRPFKASEYANAILGRQ